MFDRTTLDGEIGYLMAAYRTLFGTRERALEQIYLVLGNGYDWKDGRLVASDAFTPKGVTERLGLDEAAWIEHYAQEWFNSRSPECQALFTLDDRREMTRQMVEEVKVPKTYTYPLCDHWDGLTISNALNVPDDVRPDWLAGVVEALKLAVRVSDGPHRTPMESATQLRLAHYGLTKLKVRFGADVVGEVP